MALPITSDGGYRLESKEIKTKLPMLAFLTLELLWRTFCLASNQWSHQLAYNPWEHILPP